MMRVPDLYQIIDRMAVKDCIELSMNDLADVVRDSYSGIDRGRTITNADLTEFLDKVGFNWGFAWWVNHERGSIVLCRAGRA